MNILEARAASKHYAVDGLELSAVQATDLAVVAGEIAGICGPSGSGKSTLLRLLGALEIPSDGEILIGGEPAWVGRARRPRRRTPRPGYVMAVFQDPQSSLDPRWPLWRSITEPLTAATFRLRPSAAERRKIVARSLREVGLEQIDPCCPGSTGRRNSVSDEPTGRGRRLGYQRPCSSLRIPVETRGSPQRAVVAEP